MSRAAVVERVTEAYRGWIEHLHACGQCRAGGLCRIGEPLKTAWKQAKR
jgi:hypothetical protein